MLDAVRVTVLKVLPIVGIDVVLLLLLLEVDDSLEDFTYH